jgi:cell division protein FtsL
MNILENTTGPLFLILLLCVLLIIAYACVVVNYARSKARFEKMREQAESKRSREDFRL